MKTRELIRLLREADPSGDIECCVGNHDIYIVESAPAYYDGSLQILIRDENRQGEFNVIGAKRTNRGQKVNIRDLSIADCILDNADFPVEFEGVGPEMEKYYRDQDEKARQEAREIDAEIAAGSKA